ncbi:hypothetical protein PFISCL1PPCAC_20484 [Pristionchus fissidentatus]|uniref:Uncharacterized protein n=1 Tax=Pristionchus fissidentatus TaxID=1538716 RepID=A0AAV5WGX2_9BILA|nr:hypothetical protein PFISCL1PPCAC_20484 [Pristionchus fissidentatus]
MTVDSNNTEAVSSRTKPNYGVRGFSESVLSCPKCGQAMEPMLLGMNDDGTQTAWWTCSEVKSKKCTFPLDMPQEIFWITRSAQDIERNEVPPPNLSNLPIRYQHLYPSLFQSSRKKSCHNSRQGSHESTLSMSSFDSTGSGSSSLYDVDDVTKSRTAIKLDAMRKPKVIIAKQNSFIPSISSGPRAMEFVESFRQKAGVSASISTVIKFGRGDMKPLASREQAKKQVIRYLTDMSASDFGTKIAPGSIHITQLKKAVVEHVKMRRTERAQLAILQRMQEKRNERVNLDDLVKSKLQKNKREYEERRLAQARAARFDAARKMRTTAERMPSMPGYAEEEDEEPIAAPYAATPPYVGAASPGHNVHSSQDAHNEYDFSGDDYAHMGSSSGMDSSSSMMDHSCEIPSYGEHGETEAEAGSPFADLGPFVEGDLDGIEVNPEFEEAFAHAFGDDFADSFGDLSQYH